jgi:hypothetical protein
MVRSARGSEEARMPVKYNDSVRRARIEDVWRASVGLEPLDRRSWWRRLCDYIHKVWAR